jgi:hypothetical protein
LNKKVLELPNFNSLKISYENVISIDLSWFLWYNKHIKINE